MAESTPEAAFAQLVRLHRLPAPEREYRFMPERRFRFDFAWPWPAVLLAVEIEGGIWSGGRHVRGQGFVNDADKYLHALEAGWTVIRVPGRVGMAQGANRGTQAAVEAAGG